jgi:NTP pyrophosphatase (non-canonical NTP hydrolase)
MRTAKDMGSDKMNLIHAALGMASDAGEFVDAIKKHSIYGKELDWDNAVEEIGDVLWFCALACKSLGTDIHTVMHKNIDKLALRYPDKYTDQAAIDRADKQIPISVKLEDLPHATFHFKAEQAIYVCVMAGQYKGKEYLLGDIIPEGEL